jgi:hypothetical protein
MKKIYLILTALFGSVALSATAAPLTENKAALPQQCAQLFKETENLIAQAEYSNRLQYNHSKFCPILLLFMRIKNRKNRYIDHIF